MKVRKEGWREIQLMHNVDEEELAKLRAHYPETVVHPSCPHLVYVKETSRDKLMQILGCVIDLTSYLDVDPETLQPSG